MARMTNGVPAHPPAIGAEPAWSVAALVRRDDRRTGAEEPDWSPAGPGWHDSSWLLRRGLVVTEHRSAHLLASVLRAPQTQSPPSESVHHAPA